MQPHAHDRSTAGAPIVWHSRRMFAPATHVGGVTAGHESGASGKYASSIGGESISASPIAFGSGTSALKLHAPTKAQRTIRALTAAKVSPRDRGRRNDV